MVRFPTAAPIGDPQVDGVHGRTLRSLTIGVQSFFTTHGPCVNATALRARTSPQAVNLVVRLLWCVPFVE